MLLLFRVGLLIVFSLFDCEADSASLDQQVFYCNEQFLTLFFFLILSSINNGSSNCFLFNKLHLL